MRTIAELYDEYRIPPWLQEHQLRVAAVGKIVASIQQKEVNSDDVIAACLLHDIGAIVKFDFTEGAAALRGLCPENEIEYWRSVQSDMRARYGVEEHPATDAILAELDVRGSIRDIIHNSGFDNMRMIIENNRHDVQVMQYADMRVSPHGITSLDERLTDVRDRYADKLKIAGRYEQFAENFILARDIEERLFAGTSHTPEEITDSAAAPIVEDLRGYQI
jgi:hypothetical protein